MPLVTVLGGSGVFGARIARVLASDSGCEVRIVARNERRGAHIAQSAGAQFMSADLGDKKALRRAIDGAAIVIHAAGPFQLRDYRVAEECIDAGAHYLDLADGREFVCGITVLDEAARRRGILVTSGVSSVPAITSAMIASTSGDFAQLNEVSIALSPGNRNPRGDSTIAAVLSYLGRPIRTWRKGEWTDRPGWGDAELLMFPPKVGRRRVFNCDVPDLELFPARYGARSVNFRAGLELEVMNNFVSMLGWFARRTRVNMINHAGLLWRLSLLLYPFGSGNGALALWLRGTSHTGAAMERRTAIVTDNDGPATPCSAAIVLTRRIIENGPMTTGAMPCVELIALKDILDFLRPLGIRCVRGDEGGWFPPS